MEGQGCKSDAMFRRYAIVNRVDKRKMLEGTRGGTGMTENDWNTMERELLELMSKLNPAGSQWWLTWETVGTPNGTVNSLSIRDDEFPGSTIIEITDENLLAKLRTIKGQFVDERGWPIFYYEYLSEYLPRAAKPAQEPRPEPVKPTLGITALEELRDHSEKVIDRRKGERRKA
jgi:hypothetical protein